MNECLDRSLATGLPNAARRCAGLTSLLSRGSSPRDPQLACADDVTDWFESVMAQLDAEPLGAAR